MNERKPHLEGHQYIIAEVDILDLLQSSYIFFVYLSVVFLPLESRADFLDVVLQLDEERLHGFVVIRLNDVDLFVYLLLEDYEETIVTYQFVNSSPNQTDLLLWEADHIFFREKHQLGLSDLCT